MNADELLDQYGHRIDQREDGCWIWTGATAGRGYPVVVIDSENHYVHRLVVDAPDDKQANHNCDTPACVNPDHLYVGTQQDNMADARERGRMDYSESVQDVSEHMVEEGQTGQDHPASVLTPEEKEEIRDKYENPDVYQSDLADEYEVSRTTISRAVRPDERR